MDCKLSLEEDPIYLIAELCIALREHPINSLPGCWVHQIDEHWKISCNGHDYDAEIAEGRVKIPPFSVWVEFNGWPAGLIEPHHILIAQGDLANLENFCAALRRKIELVNSVKSTV